MRRSPRSTLLLCALCVWMVSSAPAFAQNWSFDARNVGLGGIGSTSNIALDMVDEQRPYRAVVLPFGLLQVLPNMPKLNPTNDEFDLVRTIEYAVSPIHYIVGRDDTNTASAFFTDLRNGELSRDLNTYRGFSPQTSVTVEGLASPNWGHTFKFTRDDDGPFQGIYAGAGLYFSMQTEALLDPALAAGATSRSAGSRPAAPASPFQITSASTSACSARAPISNASAIWASPCRCDSFIRPAFFGACIPVRNRIVGESPRLKNGGTES